MSDPMSERYTLSPDELRKLQDEAGTSQPKLVSLHSDEALTADDMACFSDIRAVLQKHGKLERFGVTLLHKHFEMKEGEVLLESSDQQNRTMILEPKIIDTDDMAAIDTQWYLGKAMPLALVKCRTSMHQ